MNTIHFSKMHGLGNDFMIINAITHSFPSQQYVISELANRHTGIGFDQLLIIEPSKRADFFCRIFNADGSEAEQCGNGLRCIARFIHEKKLHPQSSFTIETKSGVYPISVNDYEHIEVTMGEPIIQHPLMELDLNPKMNTTQVSILNLGNPHAIIKMDSIDNIPIQQWGQAISSHAHFPNGANVGFMQIISPQHIRLRTFERGAGETHACGSNACAAAVAGMVNGWLDRSVDVEFRFGTLQIQWDNQSRLIRMIGPAENVYEGLLNNRHQ